MKGDFLENSDVKLCLKDRPKDCNKGDFGYVALVGGCTEYSGAIRLAAMANCAMRAGAGVVTVAVPEHLASLVAGQILECTLFPMPERDGHMVFSEERLAVLCKRYRVIAIGMGIGPSKDVELMIEYLLKNYRGTLLIDADGLNALARMDRSLVQSSGTKIVLTPHVGEFARLYGFEIKDVLADPRGKALELAKALGCIVLLKGSVTTVTDGSRVLLSDRGCPGMATAGSGDVLSGVLAALLSCNQEDLLLAAAAGAYINGLAGELAEEEHGAISMIASDTVSKIEAAIRKIKAQ